MKLERLVVSDINVWQMSLITIPSKEPESYEKNKSLQLQCIRENIAALGFGLEKNDTFKNEGFDLAENYQNKEKSHSIVRTDGNNEGPNVKKFVESYLDLVDKEQDSSLLRALNYWNDIQPNDYIVMHLRDSRYYIGKVKENAKKTFVGGYDNPNNLFWNEKEPLNQFLSWAVEMEKWTNYSEEDIPSEISGMFSRRNQPTIWRKQ